MVDLWDLRSGSKKTCGTDGGVAALCFIDSKRLAVTAGRRIVIWDVSKARIVPVKDEDDGNQVPRKIATREVRLATKVRKLHWHVDVIDGLAVTRDGHTLASADRKGWVKLWDLRKILQTK